MSILAENARGAAFMMASMAAFTVNDAFMKGLSDALPLNQALFLRGLMTIALMLPLARALGAGRLHFSAADRRLIRWRNVMEVGTAYFFLTAVFNMPLANASAIMQALPLTITLAGAVFLGQAVGWRRLSAILVGLCGVLLIVRPGFDGFNIYSVYVVIAVCLVTTRDILSRKLSAEVATIDVALMNAISVTLVFGALSLVTEWAPLDAGILLQLAASACFVIGGYTFAVAAMRVGEVAVIAPFRYTSLLWALVLGYAAFGDWPDPLTFVGAGIVVVTGIYTFYREHRLLRKRTDPRGTT